MSSTSESEPAGKRSAAGPIDGGGEEGFGCRVSGVGVGDPPAIFIVILIVIAAPSPRGRADARVVFSTTKDANDTKGGKSMQTSASGSAAGFLFAFFGMRTKENKGKRSGVKGGFQVSGHASC